MVNKKKEVETSDEEKSRRQRKLERKKKKMNEQREKKAKALKCSVAQYLNTWQKHRSDWKFEKLKQNWILLNLFDEDKLPSELWPIVLEYFQKSRGNVKKVLNERCTKLIEEESQGANEEIKTNTKSKRALELLQCLDDEE